MKKNVKNLLKGVLAFALVIMLVLPNVMFIYGEDDDEKDKEDNSETKVVSTKYYDGEGKDITPEIGKENILDFEGTDLTLEYIIQPAEIELEDKGGSFDVTFVADMTYGMKDPKNKIEFETGIDREEFLERNDIRTYGEGEYERWKEECVKLEKVYLLGRPLYDEYIIKGSGSRYREDEECYLEYAFNSDYKNKKYFNPTKEEWYDEYWLQEELKKAQKSYMFKYEIIQNCIMDFVNKIREEDNINARISLVSFGVRAQINSGFTKISKENIKGIFNNINDYSPTGDYWVSNGGDGLRLGYHMNTGTSYNGNKYVIYLSDGTSTGFSYKQDKNNFYYDGGLVQDDDGKYVETLPKDKDVNNYGEYYLYSVASNLYGSTSTIKKSYVIGIGDSENQGQSKQNSNVAAIMNDYMEYVITKGTNEPINSSNTKITYNNGATAQNISEKITDVYYPVKNNAEGIQQVFSSIVDNILKDVSATNAKLTLPFNSKLQKESPGELPKDAFVLVTNSDGVVNPLVEEVKAVVKNGNTTYEKVSDLESTFDIVNEGNKYVLKGDLTKGFKFTYDKDSETYKANPIRITIKLKTSEENKKNGLDIGDGKFDFYVGEENYPTTIIAKKFGITSRKSNLVDVDFVIDEFENTAKLKLTSLDEFKKISIVDKDKNILKDGWNYSDTTKDSKYELDIVEKIEKLEKDKFFYIKVERKENDPNPYYERVEVLTNEGVETKVEKVSFLTKEEMKEEKNNKKEATLKIGAGEAVDISLADKVSFSYTIDKKTSTTPDIAKDINDKVYKIGGIELYDMEYLKEKDSTSKGKNKVEVSVTNAYENKTTIIAAAEFHTRGPLFKDVEIIEEGGKYYLVAELTDESEDLNKENPGEIKIYSDGKPEDKPDDVVKAKVDGENPRKVKVELVDQNGKPVDYYGKTIKIYGIDINNNGGITEPERVAKITSGLINPSTRQFLPATAKIVPNFRYSYGIELSYSGSGDIMLEAFGSASKVPDNYMYNGSNPIEFKGTGYTVYDKTGKKVVSEKIDSKTDVNNLNISLDSGLKAGDYVVVIDCIFNQTQNEYIGINASYGGAKQAKTYEKAASQRLE